MQRFWLCRAKMSVTVAAVLVRGAKRGKFSTEACFPTWRGRFYTIHLYRPYERVGTNYMEQKMYLMSISVGPVFYSFFFYNIFPINFTNLLSYLKMLMYFLQRIQLFLVWVTIFLFQSFSHFLISCFLISFLPTPVPPPPPSLLWCLYQMDK